MVLASVTGCFRVTADDLYSLPQPSKEYVKLQSKINAVLATGAEYSPPTSGPNRQSVQLKDLNGDGKNEAIAFFRTNGDKPLKIYIMKQSGNTYETSCVIEGDGTAIESIRYADLDGDGTMELIVGWQMSTALLHMSVYSIKGAQPVLLTGDDYTNLVVSDMDGDGHPDVIALRPPSSELPGQADMFSLSPNGEVVEKSARLSKGIDSISYVLKGSLWGNVPALFVESSFNGSSVITDILAWRYGDFCNVTRNQTSGVSQDTLRSYAVYSTDINNDGIMEVPLPRLLASPPETKYYVIDWYSFGIYGNKTRIFTTYHDFSDGWYLILPDEWKNDITVRREDTVAGERTLIFSRVGAAGKSPAAGTSPVDFLKIYTLSGDNKDDRAKLPDRFTLMEHGDTIYCAEILPAAAGFAVNQTQIMSGFKLLYTDWSTGVTS